MAVMVDPHLIDEAARPLREAAPPGSKVILFGSHARGDAGPDSDLDFLVIEPEVDSSFDESVRLRRALSPLPIAADVLVTTQTHYEYWRDTPNHLYYDVAREGQSVGAMDGIRPADA